jgi:GT2 family glycosyltransferase/protoporphyrinogen oxidase
MTQVAILGAGVAGLSTGWLLQQHGIDFVILEKQSYIGGLARSFEWHGFNCDFAAHRLFTTNEAVLQQLLNLVPMGRHVRRSRIFLRDHWMRDPLDVIELGANLSVNEKAKVVWSYLTRPKRWADDNFQNFVIRRYGKSLYGYFFKPYTEKLFGIPGDEISVLWAQQKVRLANPLDNLRENTKTKFQYFYYPIRGGYGAIVNRLNDEIHSHVQLDTTVTGFEKSNNLLSRVIYQQNGIEQSIDVDAVVSTLPMSLSARLLGNTLKLQFQKVEAVYLWVNKPLLSDLHWIYFIDDSISINRMVEFKNMSRVDTDPDTTVVCAEVTQQHENVIGKVILDLERAGLLKQSEVLDSMVVRENFAYPVYNRDYEKVLSSAQAFFGQFENLYLVGRSAEFRHREADDNFEAAIETVEKITQLIPGKMIGEKPVLKEELESLTPPVYVVLLTFNHFEDTSECLKSLLTSGYPELKIVLVDNGSTDGTPELVRGEFPNVQIIENHQNLGVPAGYNVGFQYALSNRAEYILMLNNDTVIAPDIIERLIEVARPDPQAGIVMPKVLYYGTKDQIWSSGGRYRSFPPAILMKYRQRDPSAVQMIEYAPSCGLLIHRRAFEKAGLFDPGYFFLFDDWDFSERVRALGMHIWYAPEAVLWHKVSKTTQGPKSPLYWRTHGTSIARFYRRHGRPAWISVPVHLGYFMLREFVFKRNLRYLGDFWQGVQEGLQKPLGSFPRVS